MTGMRLWIGATSSFGSAVIIVQERTCEPSGLFHSSHKPAKANGWRSFMWIKWGIFDLRPRLGLPFVEAIGQDQAALVLIAAAERRFFSQRLAARVDQAVADRRILGPGGINPQTKKSARFWPSLGMARIGWVGAMLKRGANCVGKSVPTNASFNWAGSTVKVNRPHIIFLQIHH
jgi:hypothetical protein